MNKLVRKEQKNNKGFSLVELIVVIAIMAVLVGVIAPQFLGYVEKSRRSTDITNAQSVASAVQADIADGVDFGTGEVQATDTAVRAITTTPESKSLENGFFWFKVSADNEVEVGIGTDKIATSLYPDPGTYASSF